MKRETKQQIIYVVFYMLGVALGYMVAYFQKW